MTEVVHPSYFQLWSAMECFSSLKPTSLNVNLTVGYTVDLNIGETVVKKRNCGEIVWNKNEVQNK
jgi:hypothetical protein